jgi:hypothetical protein
VAWAPPAFGSLARDPPRDLWCRGEMVAYSPPIGLSPQPSYSVLVDGRTNSANGGVTGSRSDVTTRRLQASAPGAPRSLTVVGSWASVE